MVEDRYYDAVVMEIHKGRVPGSTVYVFENPSGRRFQHASMFGQWAIGVCGVLTVADQGAEFGPRHKRLNDFTFEPYAEQKLRREPSDDTSTEEDTPLWAWHLGCADGVILVKAGVIPGIGGRYIPEALLNVGVGLPPEFTRLCTDAKLEQHWVLRRFVADVCGAENTSALPREDGYEASDLAVRQLAQEWFAAAFRSRQAHSGDSLAN